MKKINDIILKILLISMMFFTIHDFSMSQINIVDNIDSCKVINDYNHTTSTSLEHNIFHLPSLINNTVKNLKITLSNKNLYRLKKLNTKDIRVLPFIPPKYS